MKIINERRNVSINELKDNFDKRYKGIQKDADIVVKLMEDILKNGLKSPLEVYKEGSVYHIMDGQHRLRAVKRLGWKEVPCLVVFEMDHQMHPHP